MPRKTAFARGHRPATRRLPVTSGPTLAGDNILDVEPLEAIQMELDEDEDEAVIDWCAARAWSALL